ncbi:MBL fold metallo-hydrolase [Pontivivens insulae]|uniref:Beta-lactamase hydrolase-like protein n=1 Tax=Pontivivens insulae TaxID=1639689 RepID=A0A2R8AA97_9RHOB|nr:MBL fold metallo-hydrolase [Pontivivens insulae]RED13072.1 glyoxylase-like metal-dependent hydrolase (beta-lactamase superfamily II) [Pontivivens insulae]SPF29164.1 Beta-lactamase hydrolase-like protein [Pontivivens insulae]
MSELNQPIERFSPSTGAGSANVWGIYEPESGSIQYVCACPDTKEAALIDVVLNYDSAAARLRTDAMDQVLALIAREGLSVTQILDTHPHADHVMASARLRDRLGVPNAIGAKVEEIAALWRDYYHMGAALTPAPHFDRLLEPGDTVTVGMLTLEVMLSPGHTLGSISYVTGDAAFVHDTLMQPDAGTSRADFPGGSSADLWESIQAILALPQDTRLFVGHDYGTDARKFPEWEATVAQHLDSNKHVHRDAVREDYIATRDARDATLSLPGRMLAALQMNLRAGKEPEAEADGHSYLKIPLGKF